MTVRDISAYRITGQKTDDQAEANGTNGECHLLICHGDRRRFSIGLHGVAPAQTACSHEREDRGLSGGAVLFAQFSFAFGPALLGPVEAAGGYRLGLLLCLFAESVAAIIVTAPVILGGRQRSSVRAI